ncbi:MAG: hypothetical protein ACK53Y_00250, partial [bacterium]
VLPTFPQQYTSDGSGNHRPRLAPPSAITDPIDANMLYSPEEVEEREEEDNGTPKGGDDKSGEMEPQSSSSSSTSKGEGREEAMLIQDVETGLEEKG